MYLFPINFHLSNSTYWQNVKDFISLVNVSATINNTVLEERITTRGTFIPSKTIYLDAGEIIRSHPDREYPEVITFNIEKLINGDKNENKKIINWDIILIRQNPNYTKPPKVWITGEVHVPGIYALQIKKMFGGRIAAVAHSITKGKKGEKKLSKKEMEVETVKK